MIAHLKQITDEGDYVELPPLSRKVVIDRKALLYLSELQEKSQRLIKRNAMPFLRIPFQARVATKSCYISNSSSIDCMSGDHSLLTSN